MNHAASADAERAVTVWYGDAASICADARLVARGLSWLSPAERDRHARYRHDRDRDMFLAGRMMARAIVARELGTAPDTWLWRDGPRGRPEVADASSNLSFNLAHSGGIVVCAVRRGAIVGVDVESRRRGPLDRALVRRFCAPAEVADIEAQPGDSWAQRFLTYWTLKEAYLKARGLGLAVRLSSLSFNLADGRATLELLDGLSDDEPRWAFTVREIEPHHVLAAATPARGLEAPAFDLRPVSADLFD